MLIAVIFAETIVRAGGVAAPEKPRATVRIVQAAPATGDQWKAAPPERRREVVRKAADGRVELLRIIDYP
jgi:acyl-CoA reductase-like NAD-dependent aldehyde dehydrogenase